MLGLDDEDDEPDEIDAMLKVCTDVDETDDLEYVDIDDEVEVRLDAKLTQYDAEQIDEEIEIDEMQPIIDDEVDELVEIDANELQIFVIFLKC